MSTALPRVRATTGRRELSGHVALAAAAVVVGLVPLVVDPHGWFVYLPLRWTAMVGLVVIGGLAVWRSGRHPELPAAPAWAVLVGLAALSAALSAAPRVSWSGAGDRMGGAATWILYAALAALGASVVRRRSDLVVLARTMSLGVLGVAAVTMLQVAGWNWPAGALSATRPGGPFGNANFLGSYCVVAVAVCLGVACDVDERVRWRSIAAAAVAAALSMSVLSGSRSSWLVIALIGAWWALGRPGNRRRTDDAVGDRGSDERSCKHSDQHSDQHSDGTGGNRRGSCGRRGRRPARRSVLILAAAVGACVLLGVATGAPDRLGDLTGGTARGRVDTWGLAVQAVGQRPVLGWGPEGFAHAVTGVVSDEWEQRYGRRLTPDRAHNGALDVATTMGLSGLLALAVVVVMTVRRIRRSLRIGPGAIANGRSLELGIAAGLVGHLLHQQLLFQLPDVDGIAWLLAGALTSRAGGLPRGTGSSGQRSRRAAPAVTIAAAALPAIVCAALIWTGVAHVAADREARRAADELADGDHVTALEHAGRSLRHAPGQVLPALLAADAALADAARGDTSAPGGGLIDEALHLVRTARAHGFDDGRFTLAEARLLLAGGDPESLAGARRLLTAQLRHDPARAEAWLLLGDVHAAAGADHPALHAWLEAARLGPGWSVPRERAAPALAAAGRARDALEVLDELRTLRDGRPLPVELAMLRAELLAQVGS